MPLIRRTPRFKPDGTVEIALTKGKVAIVDLCDAGRVSAYQWHTDKGRHNWYAATHWRKANNRQEIAEHDLRKERRVEPDPEQ